MKRGMKKIWYFWANKWTAKSLEEKSQKCMLTTILSSTRLSLISTKIKTNALWLSWPSLSLWSTKMKKTTPKRMMKADKSVGSLLSPRFKRILKTWSTIILSYRMASSFSIRNRIISIFVAIKKKKWFIRLTRT